MDKPEIKVCSTCGSENVMADAWARWSVEEQRWELSGTYDHAFCEDCDGECHIETKTTTNKEG